MGTTEKNASVLSAEDELALRKQMDEAILQVVTGNTDLELAKKHLQAIIVGRDKVEDRQKPKRNRAEERRQWFEDWYKKLRFTLAVPKPDISNREFDRRAKMGHALFYRPVTSEMSYTAFMIAVGQAEHWTLTHDDRHKIKLEEASTGYWFWAEVAADCPRTGTSWNDLSATINLLSLEEYVIVWHAHRAETGNLLLDCCTRSWLRTRFETDAGPGALRAAGDRGQVFVDRWQPGGLSVPGSGSGGRLAEVVKNAA